ncbi:ATP-dependent RecD-like DNA helicase [Bacillus sp. AFS076308]|uniref:SF1B family DNA helicase RecD2 n=1 Tax=unclassified Bacillus (in: firmicutes) TaxID=185979 RepID=UPI000BF43D47|nr:MULTISPECIES: ATP-dependent RecD-like DNA helicase [unclassified Bacillus (in: firmicutes)]PFO03610.1 ATP-dependent RecD-like DNA helicase [Bacillus sp. AFS076308]PGV54341.1 ATP-dependent RecD-like DNA helicase [Bacillus sp. AFS037270]
MEKQDTLDLFAEQGKFVKGRPIVTIFHNEQNLYTVLRIRVDETNDQYDDKEAVITGYFPKIHEQETYVFFGEFKEHPKFGLQFHTNHFRKDMPQTKQGVIAYLSGDMFKGIGKKTAENIVETLGENAISKILNQPSLLDSIPKLPPEKAKMLYDTLMEHQGLEQVMVALNQYGFGPQISMRIYQAYKDETLSIIQKNPYQLVEDIEGIGFGRADELGYQLGITGNHPDRIKAACLYTLENESMQTGHVFLHAEDLLEQVKSLLEENKRDQIEFTDISSELIKLEEEGKIIGEEKRIYLPSLFFAEKGLVTSINRILKQTEYSEQFPESEFLLALGGLEERLGVQYAPSQREAIQNALMSPMLILTGGPGTGKTTVIKGIVELYGELHGCSLEPKDYFKKDEPFPILLAAPTGRAAKRMTESTGLPAVTIHRLLGFNGTEGFDRDEVSPLEGKILIVDETSMLDIWLANQLFKALPEHIQVIMVGDEDQLPSVGPGQVLKDLLKSERIPTVRLTDIYRQAEGSSIIELAHDIKKGFLPPNVTAKQADRSFIKCSTAQVAQVVEKVALNAKNKGYTAKDIQVLAPMYRGPAGIDRLNVLLQEIFNPNPDGKRKEIAFGDVKYRIGDKVLQLVNQPESNVFNGDIGEIISIIYAKENTEKQDMIYISFEGNEVEYTRQDLNQITHAYCCSVHKSQGSEFPIVILPITRSYYRMLQRNLIYTAITRSKQSLIICGEEDALRMGIERADELQRQTTLCQKLQESIINVTQTNVDISSELSYEEEMMQVHPMIGMENLTPYDFLTNDGN